jgi:hypothetical protein
MKHKPHWYFKQYAFCEVCGKESSELTRKYGKKPKKREDREHQLTYSYYCGCLGLWR